LEARMFIPPFVGIESVATTDLSTAVSHAHTTTLATPDVWGKSYGWYADTPGQYPASKWTWYYDNGGLYDQAHVITAETNAGTAAVAGQAHTTNLYANPNAPDFVWQKNYSTWYADTPGQYPASKWTWYYNNGGLYDQSHALAPPVAPAQGEIEEATKPTKPVAASPGHYLLCGQVSVYVCVCVSVFVFERVCVVLCWCFECLRCCRSEVSGVSPRRSSYLMLSSLPPLLPPLLLPQSCRLRSSVR